MWALVSDMMAGDVDVLPVIADAIEEGVSAGATKFVRIADPEGSSPTSERGTAMFAAITPGKSLVIFGRYCGAMYRKRFAIGDEAVYGSYNLVYTGKILAISAKRINVGTGWSRNGTRITASDKEKARSLDLFQFSWRNYDYDAHDIARRNHETSLAI